jgi:hypothetical protein
MKFCAHLNSAPLAVPPKRLFRDVNNVTPKQQDPSWKADSSSASQKFPGFYGTRKINAFTIASHLSLFWVINPVHVLPNNLTTILILSSHPPIGLPSGRFPLGFSPIHATCHDHFIFLDWITRINSARSTNNQAPKQAVSPSPGYLIPRKPKYLPQHKTLEFAQSVFFLLCERPSFTPS